MAEIDTDNQNVKPDALVDEIERTRADLARTIDEIADRVTPANVARRTTEEAVEKIRQIDPRISGAIAVAAVGLTVFLIWRKLRK
jgi:hypothetical protein